MGETSNTALAKTSGTFEALMVLDKENLARQVLALRASNVAMLGDGEVFVKRTPDGKRIRSVKVRMALSKAAGHWYESNKIKPTITAAGYNLINTRRGAFVHTPPTISGPDGKLHPNPLITTEGENGRGALSIVSIRMVGVCRNDIGNLHACDQTLHFDVAAYLIKQLFTKISFNKDAGRIVSTASLEKDPPKPGEHAIPYAAGMSLVIDLAHKDIRMVLSEDMDIRRFAERRAASICRRNVFKTLFGVQRVQKAPGSDDICYVTFVSWMADDEEFERSGKAIERIARGERPDSVSDVEVTEMDIADDEQFGSGQMESDDEDGTITVDGAVDESPDTGPDKASDDARVVLDRKGLMQKLTALREGLSEARWEAVLALYPAAKTPSDLSDELLATVVSLLESDKSEGA